MTEKINWQKELLESGKFNDKFSKNLLEHGAKNFMQGIYLGYMYSRWRKIRGLDNEDHLENKIKILSTSIQKNHTHLIKDRSKESTYISKHILLCIG